MASTAPLLENNPGNDPSRALAPQSKKAACLKMTGIGCAILIPAIFVILLVWQLVKYAATTAGCGPHSLSGYHYPGGTAGRAGGTSMNMVPKEDFLVQLPSTPWGLPFKVSPTKGSVETGSRVGTYWMNSGPLFDMYTYQDFGGDGKLTHYMRSNFFAIGSSFRMARCDGTGPVFTLTEWGSYFTNRWRRIWSFNQASSYYLYEDGKFIALVQEIMGSHASITFSDVTAEYGCREDCKFASGIKQTVTRWLVDNVQRNDTIPVPYWVPNAATFLFIMSKGLEAPEGVVAHQ